MKTNDAFRLIIDKVLNNSCILKYEFIPETVEPAYLSVTAGRFGRFLYKKLPNLFVENTRQNPGYACVFRLDIRQFLLHILSANPKRPEYKLGQSFCFPTIGMISFCLIMVLSVSCNNDHPEESEAQADPTTTESFSDRLTEVDTVILRTGTFYREVISQGKVGSTKKIDVPFTAQGLIVEVPIREGQYVQKGDVLVALDDFIIRNEMKKLEAQLNQNRLNIENHYINLGFQPNQLADIPEEVKRNAAIQFNMESLLIDQQRLKHELANSRITAPFAGTITDLKVNEGAHTSAYDKVCTLVDNRQLTIEFPVLESEVQRIGEGMSIQIVPFFQSVEKLSGAGRITNISPVVNQQGMIVCRAQPGKGNIPYRDGMRVNIFIRDAIPDVLVLPKAAVVDRQNRLVVFTLSSESRAEWNYVELGGENSDSYLIRDGVVAGDTIIMSNNFDLAHLEKVKVSN